MHGLGIWASKLARPSGPQCSLIRPQAHSPMMMITLDARSRPSSVVPALGLVWFLDWDLSRLQKGVAGEGMGFKQVGLQG